MGILIIFIFGIVSIVMLAFFAGAEVAMISVNKVRIQLLAEGGGGIQNARILNDLLKEHEMVVSAMLIGVNFALIFGTAVMTFLLNSYVGNSYAIIITTAIMPPLFLIFGELIPKKISRINADAVALKYVRVIRFFYNNFYYIVKHFTFLLRFLKKIVKSKAVRNPVMTKEEIQYLIKMSESEGVIKKSEGRMIDSVFEFNKMHLNDVMTPRNDVFAVSISSSISEILEHVVREKFSRIPVYDRNIDNILGFIYVPDLLLADRLEGKKVKDFLRNILFSPESKKIGLMLREMQKTKIHMSIVVDEFGQTAGLCTMEDLIEEIVGEIRDEYDVDEPEIIKITENSFLVNAMMDIEDVASELGMTIENDEPDDVKTIGGLVMSLLGRIPAQREEVSIGTTRFIVEKVDKQRIKQLKVIKKAASQTEETNA